MKKVLLTTLTILLLSPIQTPCSDPQNNEFMNGLRSQFIYAYQQAGPVTSSMIDSSTNYVHQNVLPFLRKQFQDKAPQQHSSGTHTVDDGFEVIGREEEVFVRMNLKKLSQMNTDGSLKAKLKEDPTAVINGLNDIVSELFKERQVGSSNTQQNIHTALSIAESASNELELAKALAVKYKEFQDPIFSAIVTNHATKTEPDFKGQRESTREQSNKKCAESIDRANKLCQQEVKTAEELYTTKMDKARQEASIIAFNKHYLHKKAGSPDNIDLEHFSTVEKYLAFLVTQQPKQDSKKKK